MRLNELLVAHLAKVVTLRAQRWHEQFDPPPLTDEELAAAGIRLGEGFETIPDEQNAYLNACKLFREVPSAARLTSVRLFQYQEWVHPGAKQAELAMAERHLVPLQKPLRELKHLLDSPYWQVPMVFDASATIEFPSILVACAALMLRSKLSSVRGDSLGARTDLVDALRLCDHCDDAGPKLSDTMALTAGRRRVVSQLRGEMRRAKNLGWVEEVLQKVPLVDALAILRRSLQIEDTKFLLPVYSRSTLHPRWRVKDTPFTFTLQRAAGVWLLQGNRFRRGRLESIAEGRRLDKILLSNLESSGAALPRLRAFILEVAGPWSPLFYQLVPERPLKLSDVRAQQAALTDCPDAALRLQSAQRLSGMAILLQVLYNATSEQRLAHIYMAWVKLARPLRDLDELVEEGLLPAIPIDPFSGQPFNFDYEKQIVWSAGPDQQPFEKIMASFPGSLDTTFRCHLTLPQGISPAQPPPL